MGLISTEVEVKPTGKMIQYYKDKGYDVKWREPLMVKVEDLPIKSDAPVQVICDYCKEEFRTVHYKDYLRSTKDVDKYSCKHCSTEKLRDVMQLLYHVDNAAQLPDFKSKLTEKCLKKYGVEHHMKLDYIQDKKENTCLKKYNVRNYSSTAECREKVCKTNMERYNVPHTMQNPEVREKANKTLCENNRQTTSRQQCHLHSLYGGQLNIPISLYSADICFPDEKLIIEYDGGGHNLSVRLGDISQEDFNKKEIIRNNVLKRAGYKQMRIISSTDKLPSDETLLQMLSHARQYFSDYPEHSWINFNIDTSTVHNAEQKDGIFFDYGELRRIYKAA